MEDLMSVIVPIYRVEQYLEQCIQSIRNQTYKNLEIILVDDGSDDKCPQICDQHASTDNRIKVIHKENGGIDSARKAGMVAATGKFVGYVDGDDWIEPTMYETLIKYIQKYNVDVVESGVIDSWTNEEKKRIPYLEEGCYTGQDFIERVEPKLLFSGIFYQFGVSPYLCTKLFIREKIYKYQLIEDLTSIIHNDTMVSMPCIANSKKIYISSKCFYHYRVRTDSLKRKCRPDEALDLLKCYPQFYMRFRGTALCAENDKQIKYYTMYWLLYRAIGIFDDPSTDVILTPFGGLKKKDRIVLYGAGPAGIHLEDYIRSIKGNNMVCWMDRNYLDLRKTLDVKNPKDIVNYEYDYVIISILRESAVHSARKDLIALGVPEEKILWIKQKYIDNPDFLLNKVISRETIVERAVEGGIVH